MRRKAMLMGMAVMAGMPGWALAKGAAKDGMAATPQGENAHSRADLIEIDSLPGASAPVDPSPGKTAEVLARVKAALMGVNYGAVGRPMENSWTMELLERGPGVHHGGDGRVDGKPLGVAFRLKF